jgi:hypothetical protein
LLKTTNRSFLSCLSARRELLLADEAKKVWREGEVYLALPPPPGMIIILDNQPCPQVYSQ